MDQAAAGSSQSDPQQAQASPPGASQPGESSQAGQQSGQNAQPSPSQPGESQQAQAQSGGSPSATGLRGSPQQEGTQQNGTSTPRGADPGSPFDSRQPNASGGGGGGLDRWIAESQTWTGPVMGDEYREWTDRLRDVEEIVGDPELRAEAARIRDRMRGVRQEVQRHSREPNWPLIQESIAEPLAELHQRITEEILRRQSKDALVPIDRDPVPPEFEELVRRYYENLGSGQ